MADRQELRSRALVEKDEIDDPLRGLSLPGFLQIVGMEEASCTIKIASQTRRGKLIVDQGELVDAEVVGGARGESAVREILGWADVACTVKSISPYERTVTTPLTGLLLRGLAQVDKGRHDPTEAVPMAIVSDRTEVRLEESEADTLDSIVKKLRAQVPHYLATEIVHVESGLSITGDAISDELDSAAAPGAYAEVIKVNRLAIQLLGLEPDSTEDVLISTLHAYFLLRMLGADYYQLLAIDRRGTPGLARILMRKYDRPLRQILGEIGA